MLHTANFPVVSIAISAMMAAIDASIERISFESPPKSFKTTFYHTDTVET